MTQSGRLSERVRRGVAGGAASPRFLLTSTVVTVATALAAVISLIVVSGSTSSADGADRALADRVPAIGSLVVSPDPGAPATTPSASRGSGVASSPSATRSSTAPADVTSSVRRSGGRAAACTDVAAIHAANANLTSSSLATVRSAFVRIDSAAGDLAGDAPNDIRTPARDFRSAVKTLADFADKATSINDLSEQTQHDPKLAEAFTALAAADQKISIWAASKC